MKSLLPEVDNFRIVAPEKPGEGWPRVEAQTRDGWVRLERLGSGYQAQIAWFVDFASRLFNHYSDSKNAFAEPAICLVDELDLHMHPKWQRAIVGRLTELFPNTQFVVTAHSPLIVQAAEDAVPGEAANLVLLRREGDHVVIDNDPVSVRNWRVDQILTSELFGLESARPPRVEELRRERQELLERKRLTAEQKKRLAEIDAKLLELPTGDTEADRKRDELLRKIAERLQIAE